MPEFEAERELRTALKEVRILYRQALKTRTRNVEYQLYNKMALIMLVVKIEVFIEDLLGEYLDLVARGQPRITINAQLTRAYFQKIIEKLSQNENDLNVMNATIPAFSAVLARSRDELLQFQPDSRLRLGKHGEKEIRRLCSKLGVDHLNETTESLSFFRVFNSMLAIRNKIIHEDSTPTLTDADIKSYYRQTRNYATSMARNILT